MTDNIHVASDLAKNQLYSDVAPEDLKWTLASGSSTETQTFYLSTKEGHFAFVQMIHSNIGLWYPTIQFTARFFGEGINTFKSVNMSNFKLSEDRCSASADNMSIELNPEHNKYKVSLQHEQELIVSFEFERVDRGYKIGEGKTYFGVDRSSGFVEHKFWPKGIVNGTFVVDGRKFDVSGTGLFVHAIQGMRPHLIASKWNFINFQSDISSLSMCEFEATPYYGGVKVNQGDPPNSKSVEVCRKNNVAIDHRARKISKKDFDEFDYVLCMDDANLLDANRIKPEASKSIVKLFGDYDPQGEKIIRDPYYGGIKGFEVNFDQVTRCSEGFLKSLGL
ncbi:165_t:CDS:2 [Entrophospora sp. SA101]|nr:165_t:CDS:2 [Entrophospora sp. SA101]CAJ0824073.1 16761_t:CDS:2 [Entrophospora sp. SA101]